MKRSRFGKEIHRRHGFTLIEMLVSVALVLLMMSLFAAAFVSATQMLSMQRGIAENDQRGRMLSNTIRGDLNARTFRDVLPFRAGPLPTFVSPPVRNGYFEIDEGDPNDDTDDVLQFTASMNSLYLPSTNANVNGSRYTGLTNNLSIQTSYVVVDPQTIKVPDNTGIYATRIQPSSYIQIFGSTSTNGTTPYTNDGRYIVNGAPVWDGSTYTAISLATNLSAAPIEVATLTVPSVTASGSVLLSVDDPDFDDGIVGNGVGASATAEICYFLRYGKLYRRVLLIRDNPNAQSLATAQPQWSNGTPFTLSTTPPLTTTTFWRDYDYSAFNTPSAAISSQAAIMLNGNPAPTFQTLPTPPFSTMAANSCAFHETTDSLNNIYQTDPVALSSMLCLGLPYQRFGHSVLNGLPQDASSLAALSGTAVPIGRFNLQECANWTSTTTQFGYPAMLPVDPILGTGSISPFDRLNVVVNPSTGLVNEYSTTNNRRGEDILMTNVLSFDVKVWDPISVPPGSITPGMFVDLGTTNPTAGAGGPFSAAPDARTVPNATGAISPSTVGANYSASGVLYNVTDTAGTFLVIGGRLNTTYGNDVGPLDGRPHYRFDTWHPNAAIQTGSTTVGTAFYNQPNYFQPDTNNPNAYNPPTIPYPASPYIYNEPPIHPAGQLALTGLVEDFPLSAIQIRINYRDVSSGQIRSMTMVQSLIYNEQIMNVKPFFTSTGGTINIPTWNN